MTGSVAESIIKDAAKFMDSRVTEFHCIMPLANVPSVLRHGILSNERAAKLVHHSVAMQAVQEKRDQK